ncbi:hypothetical protein [Rhodobacter sp. NSM]
MGVARLSGGRTLARPWPLRIDWPFFGSNKAAVLARTNLVVFRFVMTGIV